MGKYPEILTPRYRALAPRHHDGRGPRVHLWESRARAPPSRPPCPPPNWKYGDTMGTSESERRGFKSWLCPLIRM